MNQFLSCKCLTIILNCVFQVRFCDQVNFTGSLISTASITGQSLLGLMNDWTLLLGLYYRIADPKVLSFLWRLPVWVHQIVVYVLFLPQNFNKLVGQCRILSPAHFQQLFYFFRNQVPWIWNFSVWTIAVQFDIFLGLYWFKIRLVDVIVRELIWEIFSLPEKSKCFLLNLAL